MEQHLLESGQWLQTHSQDQCVGQWCAIHNPMPGPWATWPRAWEDQGGVLCRVCPCGTKHPVAEMFAWTVVTGGWTRLYHCCCGIHPCTPIDGGTEWNPGAW